MLARHSPAGRLGQLGRLGRNYKSALEWRNRGPIDLSNQCDGGASQLNWCVLGDGAHNGAPAGAQKAAGGKVSLLLVRWARGTNRAAGRRPLFAGQQPAGRNLREAMSECNCFMQTHLASAPLKSAKVDTAAE